MVIDTCAWTSCFWRNTTCVTLRHWWPLWRYGVRVCTKGAHTQHIHSSTSMKLLLTITWCSLVPKLPSARMQFFVITFEPPWKRLGLSTLWCATVVLCTRLSLRLSHSMVVLCRDCHGVGKHCKLSSKEESWGQVCGGAARWWDVK